MKQPIILSILLLMLVGCQPAKSQTSGMGSKQEYRTHNINGYVCDLLSDTINIDFLLGDTRYDSSPNNYLEPLCAHNEQHIRYHGTSKLGQTYTDYYNTFMILHNLNSDIETAIRFEDEIEGIYQIIADSVQLLEYDFIRDNTLKQLVGECKAATLAHIRSKCQEGSEDVSKSFEAVFDVLRARTNYILDKTVQKYMSYMNRDSVFLDFNSTLALRGKSITNYQYRLLWMVQHLNDPVLCHANAIEFAHSSTHHARFMVGAVVLDHEMTSTYSPYLEEMWLTWRAIMSTHAGMSSYSYIPNLVFNMERKKVAEVCINHIETNPDDMLAQGILIELAAQNNISRRGGLFGNGCMAEQMNMFPEWEDDVKEKDSIK